MQVYSLFIFSASVYCKIITGKEDIRLPGRSEFDLPVNKYGNKSGSKESLIIVTK